MVSHAAFNYLADDYGLKQVAVTGISPEDEPTAKQLKTIADFVKDKHISTIFLKERLHQKLQRLWQKIPTRKHLLCTLWKI